VRVVAAVDRRHYSVSALAGWTTPPATCPVETAADEHTATAIGVMGIEIQPIDVQRRIAGMWEAASDTAEQLGVPLSESRDALLNLFQVRISLVTNDDQLSEGRNAVVRVVSAAIDGAKQRGYTNSLPEFFLTEALFKFPRLFPLTD
jgi:hypothetical protein